MLYRLLLTCLLLQRLVVFAWVQHHYNQQVRPSSSRWSAVEKESAIALTPPPVSSSTTVSPQTLSAMEQLRPEYRAALEMANQQLLKYMTSDALSSLPSSDKLYPLLSHFLVEYLVANQAAYDHDQLVDHTGPEAATRRFLTGIQYGVQFGLGPQRFQFGVTHTAWRGRGAAIEGDNPVDFYAFGCDFFRPCMNLARSRVLGQHNLQQIMQQIEQGENVILLANHQSEADPQVVSVCFELAGYAAPAEQVVYVAGHKVTTDPLAIPFSMGRNLLCIHSKKHIDADAASKPVKQKQNLLAMNSLLDKLKAGGCLLWVAPSGGRDRRNVTSGEVPLAPFDPKTVDIFRLFGNKSRVKTHYYTLAMVSYDLCPPPDTVEANVGEERNVRFEPVGIYVGDEIESKGGLEARHEFTNRAFEQCQRDYEELLQAVYPERG